MGSTTKLNSTKMQDAMKELSDLALRHEAILVGYSGGKDSRVLADMCIGAGFKRVVGYSLLFLPDQPYQKKLALEGAKLHNIEMIIHTGGVPVELLRNWQYCDPVDEVFKAERYTFDQLTQAIREAYGIDLVALGEKNADYMFRANHIKQREKKFGYVMPLKHWSKGDVLAYLKYRNIPIPEMAHSVSGSAIDLTAISILWMYDHSREDFDHVKRWFPEIEAVVYRRELYGIGQVKKAASEPATGATAGSGCEAART